MQKMKEKKIMHQHAVKFKKLILIPFWLKNFKIIFSQKAHLSQLYAFMLTKLHTQNLKNLKRQYFIKYHRPLSAKESPNKFFSDKKSFSSVLSLCAISVTLCKKQEKFSVSILIKLGKPHFWTILALFGPTT